MFIFSIILHLYRTNHEPSPFSLRFFASGSFASAFDVESEGFPFGAGFFLITPARKSRCVFALPFPLATVVVGFAVVEALVGTAAGKAEVLAVFDAVALCFRSVASKGGSCNHDALSISLQLLVDLCFPLRLRFPLLPRRICQEASFLVIQPSPLILCTSRVRRTREAAESARRTQANLALKLFLFLLLLRL